jgi:hypothetical protein
LKTQGIESHTLTPFCLRLMAQVWVVRWVLDQTLTVLEAAAAV